MLTFANSKEEAPEITTIQPNGSDKMWIEMNSAVQQAILSSHQINPELIGIMTPGSLGTSDFLEKQDHFDHLVVAPVVNELKKVFEKLLTLRDKVPTELEVVPFRMVTIPDAAPVETVNVNKDVTDKTKETII
jgi:hypothetical protein